MMKKNFLKPLLIFCCSAVFIVIAWTCIVGNIGSPDEFNKENWPKTKEKATQVTVEYFKKEKNVDVVIDNVGHSGEFMTHEVYVEGHVVSNEQQKISATVNSGENYKVSSK
ncbi:phosphoglycolate phosphatase [Bacillus cereus]|uniref:phosphoglycolate phosphatase n=1 Tax=Bacillus cereus TaxID=1396 RepID=UPI0039812DE7